MSRKLSEYWKGSRHRRIVIAFILIGLVVLLSPIQRHFSMGRYQHYAIGVGIVGLGHILQLLASWPALPFWGRASYVVTGIFFEVIAWVFWMNPGLDPRVAAQTSYRENFRARLVVQYLMGSFLVMLCWLKWWSSETRMRSASSEGSAPAPKELGDAKN